MAETTTEPNTEPQPTSTMDIITHLAIMISRVSEVIGELEFIQGDAEEGEGNPLTEEDQKFLDAANEAVETAINEIGYGNDISRSDTIAGMKSLMDRYFGEEHICDDCRAKAH